MKAVKVIDGAPVFVDVDQPSGEGVLVDVVASSICGSDFHLMEIGAVEGRILGHEFAGRTQDGTAVAIEPLIACHSCAICAAGHRSDCETAPSFMGIMDDGGMAEQVLVDPRMLVELPTGLDIASAALTEPIAVAVHAVERIELQPGERVCVIGAGSIGLAVCAVLRSRGVVPTLRARHDHQRAVGERFGADVEADENGYDVVIDAVGTTRSLGEAIRRLRPRGRISAVGSYWDPAEIGMALCRKEISIVPAMMYSGIAPNRDLDVAARLLAEYPDVAESLITHRFPLDGVAEGFAAANDRQAGAIKVVFDVVG